MIINNFLRENNISKYRFAKMCDLPYGTLNDICIGKTDIVKCTGETLLKIANTIGIPVDKLLKEELNSGSSDLMAIKKKIVPIAEKHKLHRVYVFGSYARNEANEKSDVDLLIDREGSKIHGIFGLNALINEFKEALGKDVDVITTQSLDQKKSCGNNIDFIENVIKERVEIYSETNSMVKYSRNEKCCSS